MFFSLKLLVFIIFAATGLCHGGHSGYKVMLQVKVGNSEFQRAGDIHFNTIKGDDVRVVNQVAFTRDDLNEIVRETASNFPIIKVRVSSQLQDVSDPDLAEVNWVSSFASLKDSLAANSLGELHLQTDGYGNLIAVSLLPVTTTHSDKLEFVTSVKSSLPAKAVM